MTFTTDFLNEAKQIIDQIDPNDIERMVTLIKNTRGLKDVCLF